MIRVLLVDDSKLSHQMVEKALDGDFEVVGHAYDGIEAVESYIETAPDVVVMDIVMPRRNGIDAITEIQALDPDARVVVLTTLDTQDLLERAIRAGARDYILKPAVAATLQNALRLASLGRLTRSREELALGRFLVDSTIKVLEDFGSIPRVKAPRRDASRRIQKPVAFRIGVDGSFRGSINCYFDPGLGEEIVRRNAPELVGDEEMQSDALGEFANMIAGSIARFLETEHGPVHFSPPQQFSEERILDRVPPHCRVFTAGGALEIALVRND